MSDEDQPSSQGGTDETEQHVSSEATQASSDTSSPPINMPAAPSAAMPSAATNQNNGTNTDNNLPAASSRASTPRGGEPSKSHRKNSSLTSSVQSIYSNFRRHSSRRSSAFSDDDVLGNSSSAIGVGRRRNSRRSSTSTRRSSLTDGSWNWARLARRRSTDIAGDSAEEQPEHRRSSDSAEEAQLVGADAAAGGKGGRGVGTEGSGSCCKRISTAISHQYQALGRHCRKAAKHPKSILLPTVLTFAILTTAGLALIIHHANEYRTMQTTKLLEEGRDMAYELDDVLAKALLPLFTLQEMAGQIDEFRTLPDSMVDRPPYFRDQGRAFRNVTDICLGSEILEPYQRAAESIQRSAKMGRTLLNVQLQPSSVVCLNYPPTTTYPNGLVMDHTRAIGLDTIHDSYQSASARGSIEERGKVAMTGPLTLVQDTDRAPHETLIYWTPIFLDGIGNLTTLDGVTYEDYWGFAVVLLDWDEVVAEVGLYDFFEDRDMAFAIVEGVEDQEDKVIIASRDGRDPLTRETARAAVPLQNREGWDLLVAVPPFPVGVPAWEIWGSVLVILGSALVSLALMVILVRKADHEELLCRCIPRDILKRLHSGETVVERYDNATICYIDIVSFTSLSGRMKAHEVMNMLQVLFRELDRLTFKHNCFNAETIGDAYLAISGGPGGEDAPTGAANVAAFALDAIDVVNNLQFKDGKKIKIRVGVSSGPVVAGVIGTANVPKFTLFGETASRAEEMETSSLPGQIQCSEETMKLLRGNFRKNDSFHCKRRTSGSNDVPQERTWWIIGGAEIDAAQINVDIAGGTDVESHSESQTANSSFSRGMQKQSLESDKSNGTLLPQNVEYASSTKSSFIFENYLLADNSTWAEEEMKQKNRPKACWSSICGSANIFLRSIGSMFKVGFTNRRILLITFVTFSILCGVGLAILFVFANEYEDNLTQDAIEHAKSADRFLDKELAKALLPLFAMSELVKDVGKWYDLPFKIEETQLYNKGDSVFNNVSGICDNPAYRDPFVDIASSIKQSSEMQGILVNVQLAPMGIICLTYPKNNTEDFPEGKFLDTSGAIGLNLFETPSRAASSKATVKTEGKNIQGPISLVQGTQSVVDEAIIARYPVYIDGHNITIDGKSYPFWGMTIVLIDWDKLKSKFGLYDFFRRAQMQFRMTRYDSFNQRIAIIANSSNHEILQDHNSISVPLESSDNAWTLILGYEDGFNPPWLPWGAACVAVGSLLISLLVLMILATSKMHKQLLYRMMPREAIRKLEQGETFVERDSEATVFFSHLIGFQKMSGEMSPQDFIVMLTDLYSEFDKLALKHKCTKIETVGAYYIVKGPGPDRCGKNERAGVIRVALFALDLIELVRNYQHKGVQPQIRAGFATGPIVSGVIGSGGLPKYTVFGDTVNFSSRMESTSRPMMIQCPHKSYKLLCESSEFKFNLEEREEGGELGVYVKGKGQTLTFWVKGCTDVNQVNPSDTNAKEVIKGDKDALDKHVGDDLELDIEAIGSDVKNKLVSFIQAEA